MEKVKLNSRNAEIKDKKDICSEELYYNSKPNN